jgi:hypothetical protein
MNHWDTTKDNNNNSKISSLMTTGPKDLLICCEIHNHCWVMLEFKYFLTCSKNKKGKKEPNNTPRISSYGGGVRSVKGFPSRSLKSRSLQEEKNRGPTTKRRSERLLAVSH